MVDKLQQVVVLVCGFEEVRGVMRHRFNSAHQCTSSLDG